jgi:hypothetical protein
MSSLYLIALETTDELDVSNHLLQEITNKSPMKPFRPKYISSIRHSNHTLRSMKLIQTMNFDRRTSLDTFGEAYVAP